MNYPIFYGFVQNGELKLDNRPMFADYLKNLQGLVEVVVRKRVKKRTDEQNAYYWAVVIPILAQHFGYNEEEMHVALRLKFLRREGELATARSTTELSTIEFVDYVDRIVVWAAMEYEVVIPPPTKIDY